ncbi:MAG: hypothetical protein DRQ88_07680 [Epsilonproteobacteria bacterium]|nr:MAG: hypothetical protein DRQ89_04980 [Campylobacterota bacterium]RLA66135.1 MAG: hypothetical protein DRQ88_07680 [Campylobacterota bacterium]
MEKKQIEVRDFVFDSLSGQQPDSDKIESVAFTPLNLVEKRDQELKFEAELADSKGFKILELAQEQNERKNQREREQEDKIQIEIQSRLKLLEKETFEKAHEEGIQAGKDEITAKLKIDSEAQVSVLTTLLEDLMASKEVLFEEQKIQLLFMVKNLVKWVIMRELKDDGNYLESLLEKLILELQTQTNFNIQVNKNDFEKMPEVLESLQKKIGELKNVRFVVDYDLPEKGIVVDSDNGMIKCSQTEQFHALDKLFEKIGVFNKDFIDEN